MPDRGLASCVTVEEAVSRCAAARKQSFRSGPCGKRANSKVLPDDQGAACRPQYKAQRGSSNCLTLRAPYRLDELVLICSRKGTRHADCVGAAKLPIHGLGNVSCRYDPVAVRGLRCWNSAWHGGVGGWCAGRCMCPLTSPSISAGEDAAASDIQSRAAHGSRFSSSSGGPFGNLRHGVPSAVSPPTSADHPIRDAVRVVAL